MLLVLSSLILAVVVYLYLTKTTECKRWLKFLSSYVYLRWINRKPALFPFDVNSRDLGLLGIVPLPIANIRENPRSLNSHKHAIDGVRISGVSHHGEAVSVQVTRRHDRKAEVSLYIRLSDDEEYQLPSQPDTTVYNTNDRTFSASSLTLEVMEALRLWRVTFNGYLRKMNAKEEEDDLVLVKFNFYWRPLFNYVSFPEDYNPVYVANYMSERGQYSPFQFYDLAANEVHEQFGQLNGQLSIGGQKGARELLVRGLKQRIYGHEQLDKLQHRLTIEGVLFNGSSFHIFVENMTDGLDRFVYGYVVPSCNMTVHHFDDCELNATQICNANFHPETLTFDFTAGSTRYRLTLNTQTPAKCQNYVGENRQVLTDTYTCDVTLNDKPGHGIMIFSQRNTRDDTLPLLKFQSLPLLVQSDVKETEKLVVTFGEVECDSGQLVGGKGMSLSLMTTLARIQPKFSVPVGLCLTKTAFDQHVKRWPTLAKAIAHLQTISGAVGTPVELSDECKKLVDLIEETFISDELREQVQTTLEKIVGESYDIKRFAVRSSAIGEDGEELSAAGQNETFLGVKGLQQIGTSIVRCWASQFAFRSVEYKRQNGQLIHRGMAVVIQEMVNPEVAGVLFSRDPVTGSPDKMVITANYGLGETVVSAAVDPDTVVLGRTWDDQLSMQSVTIGSKAIQMNMSANGGTQEVEVDESCCGKCSLPEDMALELGQLALYLEKCFGGSRDIEWAIADGQIYLLQSRPVTTENPTTDEEIIHEFDTGVRTDLESYSTINIAEVCPGAVTPISLTAIIRGQTPFFNKYLLWKCDNYKFDPTANDTAIGMFYGNFFFDMIGQKSWSLGTVKTSTMKAMEVGLFGRVLDDYDVMEMALERYAIRPGFLRKNIANYFILRGVFLGSWLLGRAEKALENLPVPTEGLKDPWKCMEKLSEAITTVEPNMHLHFSATLASTAWNLVVLNILASGSSDEMSTDHYSDFAVLVGSANGAESGDVPASLEELAVVISEETDPKQFSQMSTEDALKWLQTSGTRANKHFNMFLKRHGHRGLKEFDSSCITWNIDPKQVVRALQAMLRAGPPKTKPKASQDNAINEIKTKSTPFKKFLLKLVMKGCRMGVCNREKAKSMLIKSCDSIRMGYRQLSQLMVQKGYFTDPNLLFFLTFHELQEVIDTRCPKLIKRAKHRQRMYKVMDACKFPDMIRGMPVPINDSRANIKAVLSGVQIKGLPVSQGTIQAPARVITSLSEVHTIEPGEILITHGTDIGWTPYFPLLSGVVTELGGLVSHGAVIARECGLPCIVGVENATKLFQTGDIVYLNATDGYMAKVDAQ